jgi:hypothetical protein
MRVEEIPGRSRSLRANDRDEGGDTNLRRERRRLHGVIGGAGVVAALAGLLGIYPVPLGILLAFAIWILGATVVNLLTDP